MPPSRITHYPSRGSALVGLLGALAAGLLTLSPFGERWELRTHDLRFQLRGARPTRARIVIAAITDETLRQWPEPKLFWGAHFAAAIRNARALGARWIGIDDIPAVSIARWDPDSELQFAQALHPGKITLADALFGGAGPLLPAPTLRYALPDPQQDLGFIDAREELDGVARHGAVYDADTSNDRLVPSFPAVLALRAQGRAPTDARALQALARSSAADAPAGTIWINYVGPPDAFPRIPIEKLAAGRLSASEESEIHDAVVILGPRYRGDNDVARTPYGDGFHGVEVLANTLATLWDGRPLRRVAGWQEALLTVVMGSAIAFAAALLPLGASLALACAAAGVWLLLCAQAFRSDLLWPAAGPMLGIGLAWIGETSVRAFEEARQRRWVQGIFGRYVSPEIVEHLLQNPAHLELGGIECDVSVLFVDIRGFTARSEGQSPTAVLAEVNAFFAEIVPAVDRWGGLVLQYTGDGLLAVFGAPRPVANHAQAAVDAAIEMVRISRRLSAVRQSAAEAPLRIGCSVHSGPVVCGNTGGAGRSQYSVFGDTANVAARLEELNKLFDLNQEFPSELVISAATFDLLSQPPPTRGPFPFELRGRRGQVHVYQVKVCDE